MASSTLLMISQSKLLPSLASSGPAALRLPPSRCACRGGWLRPSRTTAVIVSAVASSSSGAPGRDEIPKKRMQTTTKAAASGFSDEMRAVAMSLHMREQAAATLPPFAAEWTTSVEEYLRFLVNSKLVYDTLESIVRNAAFPCYAELRDTGLERSHKLAKDLEWFKVQGHAIPEPSSPGVSYSLYLEEVSSKDPQTFICHFYTFYFGHTAGGQLIGRKVAEKILDSKVLEFYKWDGDLPQLLQNVRDKLNMITSSWSREEKDRCMKETEKSFEYSENILCLIIS